MVPCKVNSLPCSEGIFDDATIDGSRCMRVAINSDATGCPGQPPLHLGHQGWRNKQDKSGPLR